MQNLAFKFILLISSLISLKQAHKLATFIGNQAWKYSKKNKHICLTNISLCYPDLSRDKQQKLARESLIETLKTMLELGRIWKKNSHDIGAIIKNIHGLEHLQQAIELKQGVLLAAPHFGNWEVLCPWLCQYDSLSFLYKPPENPAIEKLLLKYRGTGGAEQILANKSSVRKILQALNNKKIMAILPDQQPKAGQGIFSSFMNQPAYTMSLFSKIAAKTKVPVIMAVAKRLDDGTGFDLYFEKLPSDIYAKTSASVLCLNQQIAKIISHDPKQYQWTYKRFSVQQDRKNPYK